MTKVFIIHGWEGYPDESWLPWMRKHLTNLGCKVEIPQMPNRIIPSLTDWMRVIGKLVNQTPENIILLAHSLGTTAVLNYLSQSRGKAKLKAIILVSPFVRNIGMDAVSDFIKRDLHWSKISSRAKQFVVIHSRDDLVVPFLEGKYIAHKLKAKFLPVNHFHHFCDVDNIKTAPPILNALKTILKI